jgi:RNA polymerase primary sigma factor
MSKVYVNFNGDESISKYFKDVRKSELLSPQEEVDLAIRIKEGDDLAIDKLVESNLKFVISIAKEYQGQGLSLSDLISEGNFGLVKAAKRYDHTRGFRFISYAVHWIKQSIMQSLNDNSRTIRIPSNVIGKISQIKKEIESFEFKNEREPTNEELMENENFVDLFSLPSCGSLNEFINEDGSELYEILEDKNSLKDESFYDIDERVKEELNSVLSLLSDREREIIKAYYGIDSEYEPMTLEAIGEKYGITKERVRQIKEKAIRKVRHNAHGLFDALND